MVRWVCTHFVFLLAATLVLTGCKRGESAAPPPMPPPAVAVAPVEAQDVPYYIDEIGRCVASEMVSIQPLVSGRIFDIHFKDGAEVKKGDLLFTIDPRPYEAQLNQAKATLSMNAATLLSACRRPASG